MSRAPSVAVRLLLAAACGLGLLHGAGAAPARIVDWTAGAPGQGWVMETWGNNVREANLRTDREARGAAAQVRFASTDENRPNASLRFPVPLQPLHVYRIAIELAAAPGGAQAEVMLRRRPVPYDPMAVRRVALDERWQTVEFEATWPAGATAGDVRVQLPHRQREGSIAIRRLTVDDRGPAPLGAVPEKPFPATLIGVHVNKLGQHDTWPQAGISLLRLWDTHTTWSRLAPTREAFDDTRNAGWRRLDLYVDYVRRHRPGAAILYTLGTPPTWASAQPQLADCAYGPGTCAAPASMDEWRRYVRTVAQRYKGRIRHWELWNEPDNRVFYAGPTPLAELARAASEELKAVDPGNLLVSPGFTNNTGLYALDGFLAAGGGRWVDLIGFHWSFFAGNPEVVAASIQNVRRVMAAHGVGGKPIWNTEGSPQCDRSEAGACVVAGLSSEETEALAPRAMLTMWLNGVEAFAYYTAEGFAGKTLPLIDADLKGTTRAARRLQAFADWMVGARATRLSGFGEQGHVLELERRGERFVLVWSQRADERLQVPAAWNVTTAEPLGGSPARLPADRVLSVGRVPIRLTDGR